MTPLYAVLAAGIIALVLLDAFETVILPRRVKRALRLTSWFYRNMWRLWRAVGARLESATGRETFLGYFGPLSLILLLALWAFGLILGFALLQYGLGSHVKLGDEHIGFASLLYFSGETFFTLGFGDVTPQTGLARALAALEAGMGFGFLGTVIGYLPVIYTRFSEREIEISLLDARAGSPPSAAEFLKRLALCHGQATFDEVLRDWERWSAQLLESHLSYGVLSYFRSQHSNQSWLAALTTILDSTALVIAGIDNLEPAQARLTFAAARHALVDLTQVISARYRPDVLGRLDADEFSRLQAQMSAMNLPLRSGAETKLTELRALYEPYAQALATHLRLTLPNWIEPGKHKDNWQSGPWDKLIQAKGLGQGPRIADDHF